MRALGALAILLAFSIQSFAMDLGPSNGGGGDVVILPNDDVVLADPFLDHGGNQPNNMPPIRSLNPRILQAILQYKNAVVPVLGRLVSIYYSDIAAQLNKLGTRASDLRFYAVQSSQELADFCAPGGRKSYVLPNGAVVQSVACTAGNETFLVEPLFLRLSLRDQALLLIHERLTTLRDKQGGKNYSAIARFTTGLRSFLQIAKEQSQKHYRALTADEASGITEFYIAAEEIELRDSEVSADSFMWRAHGNGGGMIHASSQVDESAFVDLYSRISKNSVIGRNAVVKNLVANNLTLQLQDNAVVDNVFVNNIETNQSSSKTLQVEQDAILEKVSFTVATSQIQIGSGTILRNASIFNREENFKIKENQRLIDKNVTEDSYLYAPPGYKVKPVNISGKTCPENGYVGFSSAYWEHKGRALEDGMLFDVNFQYRVTKGIPLISLGGDIIYSQCSYTVKSAGPTKMAPAGTLMITSDGSIIQAGRKRAVNFGGYPYFMDRLLPLGFQTINGNVIFPIIRE